MNLLQSWVAFRDASTFESSVAIWFVHVVVVVLIAWLCAELLARQFTALRYGIWIIACLSLVLLAGVTLFDSFLPINLRVLPVETVNRASEDVKRGLGFSDVVKQAESTPAQVWPIDRIAVAEPEKAAIKNENAGVVPAAGTVGLESSSFISKQGTTERLIPRHQFGKRFLVLSIYLTGVLAVLSRILIGYVRLARLRSRAVAFDETEMQLAQQCAREIGLRSCPVCLQSDEVAVPMAVGILHRVVLLPTGFKQHQRNVQRHCLLHEIAHVAHHDGLWNLIGEITFAIYWFHPAVYLTRKRLLRSREYTADDRALRCCQSPASYSRTLLALSELPRAEHCERLGATATTQVERRIRRVLDPDFRTRQMPQWLLLFPAALIVAVSTCVFRLDSAVAQSPPAIKEPVYDPGKLANRETDTSEAFTSTYQKFDSVPLDETTDPKAGKAFQANIFGVVTDEDDPVENAIVLVRLANYDNDQQPKAVPIVARTRTNERGQYKVQFSHNTLFQQSDFDCIEVLVADRKGRLSMGATKAAERQPADYSARVDIALTSRSTLQSMVQSQDGKPMEGAKVSFQQTFFRYGSSGRDPFGQPRAIDDPFTYKTRVFHFPTPRIRPTVITKSDGKFQIAGPVSAVARVEKESYFQRTPYLYVGNAYDQVRYFRDKLHSPAVIKLEKEFKLTTRVVDEQGDDVREFRTRVGHSFDGQRQEKVSRLVTTKRYLRESANRDGEVRLLITFPEQSGLLSIEKWIDIDELIESPSLDFVAEKGIWLSGQVVKRDTELGVSSALAMWHQNAGSNDHSIYRGATDANGKWKLLAPRKLGYVSIYGKVAGYDLMDYEPRKTPEKLIYKIALVGNEPSLRIPDFKIEPINQRTVVVVDSNGKPVAGASVRTQYHKKYLDKDKRVFRLRDDLASDMQTNADGSCLLTLTRTIWEDGIVSVHNIYVPEGIDTGREKDIDDLLSIGKARIRSGKSPIQPNENGPVKVVLFDLVNVRGRVLVDGKPHPKILVGLATRTKKNGPFDSVYTGFHSTDEGRFEIATPRGREYSVVLMLPRTESSSAKRHIHQTPIEISKGLSWNAGTISVDQSQF